MKKNLRFAFSFLGFAMMCFCGNAHAQKRADKKALKQLKEDIEYLAADSLEGRRTATRGEKLAAAYLISRYEIENIPAYRTSYKHPFPFVYGKKISPLSFIAIDNDNMKIPEAAFPLPFSANTTVKLHSEVLPDVREQGNIWLLNLYESKEEAANPHFDWEESMVTRAKNAKKQGATAVLFYDGFQSDYAPAFHKLSDVETLDIPVGFLTWQAYYNYVLNRKNGVDIDLKIQLEKSDYTGNNVAAFIDNNAPYTVVLGAHFDHLGFGEDGNSTYTGKDRQVHNGADDNASGTAGLLQLASWIKKKKLNHYNYLFVHFSGEELGLYGSKAFVKEIGADTAKIAYMLNMDMIGRLNDSTHALTIGGVGTSPAWSAFTSAPQNNFKIVVDSAGVGPSDHTSFYLSGIPVLFLFTGLHHDYHKPSDDADKINYAGELQVLKYAYNIISKMDAAPRPAFTKTKESSVGKVRFKVTLGIMPDYSFSDGGVRVDGVSEDRPAVKAGIQPGDVITKLGGYDVKGMQSYMEALSKMKSGETVDVTVERKGKPVTMKITL